MKDNGRQMPRYGMNDVVFVGGIKTEPGSIVEIKMGEDFGYTYGIKFSNSLNESFGSSSCGDNPVGYFAEHVLISWEKAGFIKLCMANADLIVAAVKKAVVKKEDEKPEEKLEKADPPKAGEPNKKYPITGNGDEVMGFDRTQENAIGVSVSESGASEVSKDTPDVDIKEYTIHKYAVKTPDGREMIGPATIIEVGTDSIGEHENSDTDRIKSLLNDKLAGMGWVKGIEIKGQFAYLCVIINNKNILDLDRIVSEVVEKCGLIFIGLLLK